MTKMAKFEYQDGGRLDVEIIFISRLQGHQFSGDALLLYYRLSLWRS